MSDSVGAQLRQARELRRLTLQQVSDATKLRPHYLQALESDDHSAIPSGAQARGFLRIYAAFLELEIANLVPAPKAVEPVPEVPVAADTAPSSAPRPNLWASLRQRLERRKKEEPASADTTLAPAVTLDADIASEPAAEGNASANNAPPVAPSAGEKDPGSIKKNAIS